MHVVLAEAVGGASWPQIVGAAFFTGIGVLLWRYIDALEDRHSAELKAIRESQQAALKAADENNRLARDALQTALTDLKEALDKLREEMREEVKDRGAREDRREAERRQELAEKAKRDAEFRHGVANFLSATLARIVSIESQLGIKVSAPMPNLYGSGSG